MFTSVVGLEDGDERRDEQVVDKSFREKLCRFDVDVERESLLDNLFKIFKFSEYILNLETENFLLTFYL